MYSFFFFFLAFFTSLLPGDLPDPDRDKGTPTPPLAPEAEPIPIADISSSGVSMPKILNISLAFSGHPTKASNLPRAPRSSTNTQAVNRSRNS